MALEAADFFGKVHINMGDGRKIARAIGRKIFDPIGNPAVEVDVVLLDESGGRAAVMSGELALCD
ncbi:MAG: hypothetical protein LBI39_02365 [Puniceicoccales bacterium]|nr:hypothetical protein [Puniceicoccales bacterium]